MSEKEIKMSKYINDYGMAITVKAKEDDFLFIDGIGRCVVFDFGIALHRYD